MSAFFAKIFALILSVITFLTAWLCPVQKNTEVITFDANPSTGYSWFCEMDPEGVVKIDKEFFKQPPTVVPVTGAGGTYTYVIVPVADGKTTLTFYYMREWEGQESAVRIEAYSFTVTDGKIHMDGPIMG